MAEKGSIRMKRWMQALGLVYVLMCLPAAGASDRLDESGSDIMAAESSAETESAETGSADDAAGEKDDGLSANKSNVAPVVALTFDDGPSAQYTPVLLDGLKERGVHATFFLIGQNIEKDGNEALVKRMWEEGHLIGNHTYHHVNLSSLNLEAAHRELTMTDEIIQDITGEDTILVRPPFGAFPDSMEQEMSKLYVKWTVDPLDWTINDTDEIVRRVVTDVEENDIILLHDCYESSVEAALRIVDILTEEGYEFVTADRLLIE